MDEIRKNILIVDDNITTLSIGQMMLKTFYKVYPVSNIERMFDLLENVKFDLVLLDIEMPDCNGFDVIKKLKANQKTKDIPVIFLTIKSDYESEIKGFDLGAADFIIKPFSAPVLLKRVQNVLLINDQVNKAFTNLNKVKDIICIQNKQIEELQHEKIFLRQAILQTIVDIIDFRDSYTGGHFSRVKEYFKIMYDEMIKNNVYLQEVKNWEIDSLLEAVKLHDIGKIATPDYILSKDDKLTNDEYTLMKNHVEVGIHAVEKIIAKANDETILYYTYRVVGTHHEKFDGSGYPVGLSGNNIPLEGRVLAIVDVYDAIVSKRSYKNPLSHEEAVDIINKENKTKFDPVLIELFNKIHPQFKAFLENLNK